jgi:hypothetical protein
MMKMSTPREPEHDHCSAQGCTICPNEKSYECQAKACAQDHLCVGCVFQCADCEDDFCEHHILDLSADGATRYSIYLCQPCAEGRREREAA